MKKFRGRRLLAMVMAVLMVIGMMPTDWAATVASAATTFEGGQEVTDGTWAGWTWSVFGEGTGNIGTDNKITDNGSSVTLYSSNNKGKISNNNDGGNYLYRKVDAGSDFIITADVKVDSWTAANQQAWGLITMSAVQNNGYTGKDKYNSSALVGGVQIAGVVGFTQVEINKITNGASASVTLDVKSTDSNVSDADKQAVADAIAKLKGSYKVGAYFDISVIKNVGGVSSQVSNLTAPVKITMTLDDSLINTDAAMHREYMVIRVHGDEVDALDATFDPATKQLSFYSDKFSTYAVVYKDTYASAPMTGDSANASMYVMVLMLAVLLMGCAGYGMKKRSKVNR